MISVVNESSYTGRHAVMVDMAAAVDVQVHRDFAPLWGRKPWHVSANPPRSGRDVVAHIVDEDKNVPGALAYHDDTGKVVDIVVMAKTILDAGGTWTTGDLSVSAALSHEVLELIADPWCDYWATAFLAGRDYALEVCDPVQASSYDVNGISVSDFVLPAWFRNGSTSRVDFLGTLTDPFEIARGGYAVVSKAGSESQIFGDVPGHHGYRSMRRVGF